MRRYGLTIRPKGVGSGQGNAQESAWRESVGFRLAGIVDADRITTQR
jgi:hypothetical protein